MFLGGKFKFNGIHSHDMYGAILCYTGTNDGRDIGVRQEINNEESGINGFYNYKGAIRQNLTIPVEIGFGRILTQKEKRDIINWLFVLDDQYKELEVEDTNLIYFVKFKNAKWIQYGNGVLINAEIETDSAYAYSPIIEYYRNITSSKPSSVLEIDNYCNVFTHYNPNIEITFRGNGTLNVINNTLGETMTVKGVDGEVVKINCIREIANSSVKIFKYSDIENYLKLKYGKNKLTITGVNADVKIICRYPMLFE